MLRGAIDYASADRIGGWLYSEAETLRDHAILAFIDDVCVGAGYIDQFRQDLADAGVGDGFVGFNFIISPPNPQAVARLVIKLEGSDAALMQRGSRIAAGGAGKASTKAFARSSPQIEWMRSKGWLTQTYSDFLKFIEQAGVYDRSLLRAQALDGTPPTRMEPLTGAQEMFDLLNLEEVEVEERSYADLTELIADLDGLIRASREPIVALWTPNRAAVLIGEGTHVERREGLEGGIEYGCGPDRLLFVDLRCAIGRAGASEPRGLKVFFVPEN